MRSEPEIARQGEHKSVAAIHDDPDRGIISSGAGMATAMDVSRLLAAGEAAAGFTLGMQGLASAGPDADLCLITGACAYSCHAFKEAEDLWRKALAINPDCSPAWFNLGLLFAERGCDEEAEHSYSQALTCEPQNNAAHCNLALLLARRRRYVEAEAHYRAAIAADPGNADYHCNFGSLFFECKRIGEAEASYRRALELAPNHAGTQANLGALLGAQNRHKEAESFCRQAIALAPENAVAHCNLGMVLMRQARYAAAEQCFNTAIGLAPDHAESYTNLGLLLDAIGRDEEAESRHRQSVALQPASQAVWSNLGNLLAKRRRYEEAEACYRQAIALDRSAPEGHVNLGVLFATVGSDDVAEGCFRDALALDPGHPRTRLNLAYLLLGQGRLAEGWPLCESRYDARLSDRGVPPPAVSFPQWQGQSLRGKSLLVWPEQGLGDEIQFCRYGPMLKRLGAARLTWAVKGPLAALLRSVDGVDEVISLDEASARLPPHDFWTFALSLPLHCGTVLETIPAAIPYLRVSPERIARWSTRLPVGGRRVGLVWKGNSRHPNDGDRSLPDLRLLSPLWAVPEVRFISLQKGEGEAEVAMRLSDQPLLRLGSELADIADTAAVIQQLDLLICVDTAVAHLAGALGIPCWVLLPAHNTDWRWLKGRDDSPWYPEKMRLFRQTRRGEWEPVIEAVREALAAWRAHQRYEQVDMPG